MGSRRGRARNPEGSAPTLNPNELRRFLVSWQTRRARRSIALYRRRLGALTFEVLSSSTVGDDGIFQQRSVGPDFQNADAMALQLFLLLNTGSLDQPSCPTDCRLRLERLRISLAASFLPQKCEPGMKRSEALQG